MMTWRCSTRTTIGILLGWMVVAIALCGEPIAWHLDFVRESHPNLYVPFFLVLLALTTVVPAAHHLLRRNRLWRHEPLLLAGVFGTLFLWYEPVATAVCLSLLASAFALGHFAWEKIGLPRLSPVAEIAVCTGVGMATYAWLLYFVGLAGGYQVWVFVALLFVPCLVLPRHGIALLRAVKQCSVRWGASEGLKHPLGALLVVVSAALMLCGAMVILAPSITFDPLKFHLPLAQHYAATGGLDPLDIEVYSYYPQGVEVLMTVGERLAGQAAAQMIPVLFFGLMLAALFAVLRECKVSPLGSLTGVVFAAVIPFVHWTGVNPKNDLALAFYVMVALLVYLRWRNAGGARWLLVGVFFVAAACSVKLPALFGLVALTPLYALAWWREGRRLKTLTAMAVIFVAFGTIWQFRTWMLTGNPVYPQGVGQTGALRALNLDAETAQPSRIDVLLLWPRNVVFGGQGFASVTPNPLGLALVLFLPLLWLVKGEKPARVCWVFVAIYIIYWSLYYPVLRYAIAPIAVLFGLLGARAAELCRAPSRGLRFGGYGATAIATFFSLCVVFVLEINAPQFLLFSGKIDKNEFLHRALLTYSSLEFLQKHAEPGEATFGVQNCSRAYAPEPELFGCEYSDPTPEGLHVISDLVSKRDYRYLILPSDPAYAPFLTLASSESQLERLHRDANFGVYEFGPKR